MTLEGWTRLRLLSTGARTTGERCKIRNLPLVRYKGTHVFVLQLPALFVFRRRVPPVCLVSQDLHTYGLFSDLLCLFFPSMVASLVCVASRTMQ